MRSTSDDIVARFVTRWLPVLFVIPFVAAGGAGEAYHAGLVQVVGAIWIATGATLLALAAIAGAGVRRLAFRDRERHDAQERTRESEGRLRAIIRSATDAIITADEAFRITVFNEAAEATFRCPAAQAVGAPLDRFVPQEFWEIE